jgi:hypothetical protein
VQIKLDELIRATETAENTLLDLEELDEVELERFRSHYEELACKARALLENAKKEGEQSENDDRPVPNAHGANDADSRQRGPATDVRTADSNLPAQNRALPVWPTSED